MKKLFSRQDSSSYEEMRRQAKVQCNSDCQLSIGGHQQKEARVRDLSWYGLTMDRVEVEDVGSGGEFDLSWVLPREFGAIELKAASYAVTQYRDIIADRQYAKLEISLEEGQVLEDIRAYLLYRNKSFIRSTKRRNRSESKKIIYVLYGPILMIVMFLAYKIFMEWLTPVIISD